MVQGGSLNLSGTGIVKETKPNYGAIMIIGSSESTKKDFSTISIGKNIILEGWSGIFINHQNKAGYGILINMNGSINAVNDVSGAPGAGIYVNGNILDDKNSPIINLSNTVKITSTGNGIYAAGYATYNINGAYIQGEHSGLGIKSGRFNILDGTIIGSGEDKTPTSGNNNGINPSGAAIQIESNSKYTGNMELYIKSGAFQSKNSNVLYEYVVGNNITQVKDMEISGGTFISNSKKDVFNISPSLKNKISKFIIGGKYSSDPKDFLKAGYTTQKNDTNLYEVMTTTMVFGHNDATNNNMAYFITIIIFLTIIITIIYLNRKNISVFIKSLKIK